MADMASTPLNDRFGIPRLTQQQAQQGVYMGSKYGYQAGAKQAVTVVSDEFVPTEQAWGGYMNLSPDAQNLMIRIMNVKAGSRPWNPEELRKLWSEGVLASNYIVRQTGQRVSPIEALRQYYLGDEEVPGLGKRRSSGGGGGGGGGGYSGPVTQTRLTDPTTAENLLDTSLKNYLGRSATGKEKQAFLKALNRYEIENPTVTTPVGPGGTVTTGGAQPTVFAEQFAQAQEGAAEYQAATTYLDSFLGALGNPVG
jgi:hypothetical protein